MHLDARSSPSASPPTCAPDAVRRVDSTALDRDGSGRRHVLLASPPLYGHLAPMLGVGRELAARGHAVSVLTGRKYRSAVVAAGLGFRPLPAEVDYDDANLDAWLPGWGEHRGLAAARHDILGLFVRPLAAQYAAIRTTLATEPVDTVLADTAFLGVLPLLVADPTGRRVPVLGVSATPLSLTSVDTVHFGSGLAPVASAHDRFRRWLVDAVLRHGPLRPLHDALDAALAPYGVAPGEVNYFDLAASFDRTFHLSVAGLEYPRRELPPQVSFVGPLRPAVAGVRRPAWWADLDGRRPVVHLTQGTMDNADLGKLLVPALRGLAREDVLVVAATGGRSIAELADQLGGRLPDNARVAEFLDYDALLPRTAVMVTNGGFGGVQQALAYGVPLVVAGTTEDKPEVAARVAWSGCGLNLRTGRPTAARVRAAVRTVLGDPRFRADAARLQAEIAGRGDPVVAIADAIEAVTADFRVPVGSGGSASGRPTCTGLR